jgi:DNA polymerase III subunit delta'
VTLFGHDAQVAAFLDAHRSGRLHHAWLLAGPEGVGKGGFARAAALRILADGWGPAVTLPGLDVPADHRAARLWAAGSHPDVMLLERLWRDKTKDFARSITVDQVRGLGRLFAMAPAFSPWRVVLIDAADDLERGGANALLKLLEEPPAQTVFLLVSHAPHRLLPTIRSRCRVLRFDRLDDADMAAALSAALPDAPPDEIAALAAAGEGTPGRALGFAGLDVGGLDRSLDTIARTGDRDNATRVALARALAGKAAQPRYELFLQRAPSRIAAVARRAEGDALAGALAAWERATAIAGSAVRLSADPQATVFEIAGLLASLAPTAQTPRR